MRFLVDIQDESITKDILKSIVRMCQYMHSSVIDASDLFLKVSRKIGVHVRECEILPREKIVEMVLFYYK